MNTLNPSMEKTFSGLKNSLKFSGMWPPTLCNTNNKLSRFAFFNRHCIVSWINMIMYVTIIVSETAYIIDKWPDFDEVTSAVVTVITSMLTFVKMTSVYANRHSISATIFSILYNDFGLNSQLLSKLADLELNQISVLAEEKSFAKLKNYVQTSLEKKSKEFKYIFWLNTLFIGMTLLGYCITPAYRTILTGNTVSKNNIVNQPFKSRMPYDLTTFPGYHTTYLLHVWASIVTFSGCAGVDNLVCAHLIMTTRQFEIISHVLENLQEYTNAFLTIGNNKHTISESNMPQTVRAIKRQRIRDLEHMKNEIFNECVQHYDRLMKFIQKINSVFGLIFISQLLISSLQLCLVLFKYKTDHNPENKMTYLIFIGASLSQLFIYCWYGQAIINVSSAISDSIYGTPWYSSPLTFRRSCLMMLRQSHRIIHLSALGFSNLSLTTMTSIWSTAVSYFTLLKSLLDE